MVQLKRLGVRFGLVAMLLLIVLPTQAFVIKKIDIVGANLTTHSAVLKVMKLNLGQNLSDATAANVIRSLYKSGLYSDVRLSRRANTLVVYLTERPTISAIEVQGNSEIKNKQLKPVFEKEGFVEGRVFDHYKISQLLTGLEQQYQSMGYYDAKVTLKTKKLPRNRVAITVQVKEGVIAKVKHITFSGNHTVSAHTLLKQMKLQSSGFLSWFNKDDRYSAYKFDLDMQSIKDYYLDNGYLDFRLVSKKVKVAPNDRTVSLVIVVDEGPVYHLGAVKLTGKSAEDPAVIKLVTVKPGDVFSKQSILDVNKHLASYFRDKGFALPAISVSNVVSKSQRVINLTWSISSGRQVYVRKVHFTGNDHTQDLVLRSRVLQMEGAVYSQKNIDESKRKLMLQPYFQTVTVDRTPVPDDPAAVDLDYKVKEVSAGAFNVNLQYSDLSGFGYGTQLYEQNFNGTGKAVNIGFMNDALNKNYSLSYTDPMYTPDGVSRTMAVNFTRTTPERVGLTAYNMDQSGFTLGYGIPVTEKTRISTSLAYKYTVVKDYQTEKTSPSITQYMGQYPSPFNQFIASLGWSYDSRDRFPFAEDGQYQTISMGYGVPIRTTKVRSLGYYKLNYSAQYYFPLTRGFILSPSYDVNLGSGLGGYDSLPFFENYYGGGVTSLPSFSAGSLGPKNPNNEGESLGGNISAFGRINLILPSFINPNVRTALYVGAGNVFETHHVDGIEYEQVKLRNLRASAGLVLAWKVPMLGPLQFSLSSPIIKKAGDETEIFGFTFGSNL